jgi:hypothetical protein
VECHSKAEGIARRKLPHLLVTRGAPESLYMNMRKLMQLLLEQGCSNERSVPSLATNQAHLPGIDETKQIAAYSVMHQVGRTFLLLKVIDAESAADVLKRLNEAKSPDMSIAFLDIYDQTPLDLCGQFEFVKCPNSFEEALEMALEPWHIGIPMSASVAV